MLEPISPAMPAHTDAKQCCNCREALRPEARALVASDGACRQRRVVSGAKGEDVVLGAPQIDLERQRAHQPRQAQQAVEKR